MNDGVGMLHTKYYCIPKLILLITYLNNMFREMSQLCYMDAKTLVTDTCNNAIMALMKPQYT